MKGLLTILLDGSAGLLRVPRVTVGHVSFFPQDAGICHLRKGKLIFPTTFGWDIILVRATLVISLNV